MDSVPTYGAIHDRLRDQRGRAGDQMCAHCGDAAQDWALNGEPKWLSTDGRPYTDDLDAYTPLCGSCHSRLDRGLQPCPHGPARERRKDGGCRACYLQKRKDRYQNDPEWKEKLIGWSRERREDGESREKDNAARRSRRKEKAEAQNARKRDRYANDPEYREKLKARSREYEARKKRDKQA